MFSYVWTLCWGILQFLSGALEFILVCTIASWYCMFRLSFMS